MSALPSCPECKSEYSYEMGALLVCSECAHEWNPTDVEVEEVRVIKDASGNVLSDGDDVTIIKDLKVKGSSNTLKVGTKVRGIRLVDGTQGFRQGDTFDIRALGFQGFHKGEGHSLLFLLLPGHGGRGDKGDAAVFQGIS